MKVGIFFPKQNQNQLNKKPIHEELMQISKLTRAQATPLAHCNIDTIELLKARIEHLHYALKEKDTMILQAALTVEMLQEKLYEQDILNGAMSKRSWSSRYTVLLNLKPKIKSFKIINQSMQVLIQKHKNEIALLRQAKTNLENMQHLLP